MKNCHLCGREAEVPRQLEVEPPLGAGPWRLASLCGHCVALALDVIAHDFGCWLTFPQWCAWCVNGGVFRPRTKFAELPTLAARP